MHHIMAHIVSLTTWHAHSCAKVREAYRRRGWGFNNPQGIAQCEKEGFLTKLKVIGTCWLRSSVVPHKVWPGVASDAIACH
jgi:Endoplasmic reticulum vesicle transporter